MERYAPRQSVIDCDGHILEPFDLWDHHLTRAEADEAHAHLPGAVRELEETMDGMPRSAREKLAGENARRVFGL